MYKNDLTTIVDKNGNEIIYIGWLTSQYNFNKGAVSDFFTFRLWEHLKYKIDKKRGYYKCDYCRDFIFNKIPTSKYNKEIIKTGYYDVIVFDKDEKIYRAPSLIFHYIQKHKYLPPIEFIDAVCYGISPNSFKYSQLLNKYGFLK